MRGHGDQNFGSDAQEFLQSVVAHSFNVKDEAGRSLLIQDQPGVHSKTLWKERKS